MRNPNRNHFVAVYPANDFYGLKGALVLGSGQFSNKNFSGPVISLLTEMTKIPIFLS
jgi:hypothetical protein